MLEKYLSKIKYDSYEDFVKNFKINVPENFNFGFDVVDAIADKNPDKIAMVWCDVKGAEAKFTFKDLKEKSNKVANFFKSIGIKKGDPVMLILKRRYQYWFAIVALHKIGAIAIPATHLLTAKDLAYRNNAASIKMIVSVYDDEVINHIEESIEKSPSLKFKALVGGSKDGWFDFNKEVEKQSAEFKRTCWKRCNGKFRYFFTVFYIRHNGHAENGQT